MMKVLIVCNNAYMSGNGICTAVLSLIDRLKHKGIAVRLMACENPDPDGPQPEYRLKHFKFPFFEPIIYSNGFRYATFDKKTATEALKWADIVHFCEGFPLEGKTARLAQKMGVPCVGTYHLLTENVMANLGMKKAWLLNYLVTQWWRKAVYDRCRYVQCPTETVKKYLLEHGFKSNMKVISNGIELSECSYAPRKLQESPVNIICIGRLSYEKSQETLLNAMAYSRHADRIQLHFAGKGPKMKKYQKLADKLVRKGILKYKPQFGYYKRDQLKELIRQSHLFVHCAWVEVEGLSCVEAIAEGVVPVIAEGQLTAASQFALDERSMFPESDSKALAQKIDWWIDHPEERSGMERLYAESVEKYSASGSTAEIIRMYVEALAQ